MSRSVRCPECSGFGSVWADYNGAEVRAECPYCGGGGQALAAAVERDYPATNLGSTAFDDSVEGNKP